MLPIRTAVLKQIAYARSVREVIRSIMRRMLDGDWIDRIFSGNDSEFNRKLDGAFLGMDESSASKADYCMAVVNTLCEEVSDLCLALKEICEGSGYGDVFNAHISHERFVRLVLQKDVKKLVKMQRIVADMALTPIDVLREIGAIVNEEPIETRAALDESTRLKANAELKEIALDLKVSVQSGFSDVKHGFSDVKKAIRAGVEDVRDDIGEVKCDVEQVDKKISHLRLAKKSKCKYDVDLAKTCVSLMASAKEKLEVKYGLNTRVTYKAAFDYNRATLVGHGITTVAEFTKIIRAQQAREQRQRMKSRDISISG